MKESVRFAIGWEIDEKGAQNGQDRASAWRCVCVSLSLRRQTLSMHTLVEAHVHILSRISPRAHEERIHTLEHKLCQQAQVLICMNPYRKVFFHISNHISTKTHPKHVPTPSKVSGFHVNSSHNKTQAFTSPKTY